MAAVACITSQSSLVAREKVTAKRKDDVCFVFSSLSCAILARLGARYLFYLPVSGSGCDSAPLITRDCAHFTRPFNTKKIAPALECSFIDLLPFFFFLIMTLLNVLIALF